MTRAITWKGHDVLVDYLPDIGPTLEDPGDGYMTIEAVWRHGEKLEGVEFDLFVNAEHREIHEALESGSGISRQ